MTPKDSPTWWQRIRKAIDLDRADALVIVGLLLIAAGCWDVWRPGSLIVPGAVLIFYALPTRPPFIHRPEQKPRRS